MGATGVQVAPLGGLGVREELGGGGSTVDGGLAAVCEVGTALQWTKAKEIGPMRTSEAS